MTTTNIEFRRKEKHSRVLVTGGAGFIGSHLCERLLSRGYEVFCLDNFGTGSGENVASLCSDPRFHLIEHDITEPIDLKVDRIFNLACPASPPAYQADPIQTTRTSVVGSYNLLELALKHRAVIVQASTSEVYGDPAVHPQEESYWGNVNPTGPRSCYDEGKRCAESLFFDYHRLHRLPVKVARLFNTYGPRMQPDDGRVVSNLIVQALQNQPLTIFGNGLQTRSFCYVYDMVSALIRLSEADPKFTGPVNLGNPEELTILDLVEMVIEMTGSRSRITFRPLPQDDPRKRRPDISLARGSLGWQPTTSMREGLRSTILYFEKVLERSKIGAETSRRSENFSPFAIGRGFDRSDLERYTAKSRAAAFSMLSEKP